MNQASLQLLLVLFAGVAVYAFWRWRRHLGQVRGYEASRRRHQEIESQSLLLMDRLDELWADRAIPAVDLRHQAAALIARLGALNESGVLDGVVADAHEALEAALARADGFEQ